MIRIPVILGPTAVGKTDVSLALASEFSLDIVSCDSRQIYRGMDIGTAKPTVAQQRAVAHWLIDIVAPDQEYSCFQFGKDAADCIRQQASEGRGVLVCGGSGLYFSGLSKGIGPAVEAHPEIREQYRNMAQTLGNKSVFDELVRCDPQTASGSHPSNVQRNIRALEVFKVTGYTQTELKKRAQPPADMEFLVMACVLPRDELYQRINDRVEAMLRAGLWEEFKSLRSAGFGQEAPGMRCVGYKEFFAVEKNEMSLTQAVEKIKQNSRNYAKRQITWLKHQVTCVEIGMHRDPFEAMKQHMRGFFKNK